MGILNTYRGGYQRVQDTTATGSVLDGSTAGKTYDFTNKPAGAMWMGEEYNGVELMFLGGIGSTTINDGATPNTPAAALLGVGDTTGTEEDDTFDCVIWGWADNGPAERMVDLSITSGTARYKDYTTCLWANKIVEVKDYHVAGVGQYDADGTTKADGQESIAKLAFDTAGLRWIYCEFSAGSNATADEISVFARPY